MRKDFTIGDIIRLAEESGREVSLGLRPLTDEEREKGPDVLAKELQEQLERELEGKMDTFDMMLKALGTWMKNMHQARNPRATSGDLNNLALCCEDVARTFLHAAGILRTNAEEARFNEDMAANQLVGEGGVRVPRGFVKQKKRVAKVKGDFQIWKHPDGRELRIGSVNERK